MRRRDFLKLVCATLAIPKILDAPTKLSALTKLDTLKINDSKGRIMGIALQDIPKDGWGWITVHYRGTLICDCPRRPGYMTFHE